MTLSDKLLLKYTKPLTIAPKPTPKTFNPQNREAPYSKPAQLKDKAQTNL